MMKSLLNAIAAKFATVFHVIANFNPLNDWLYPKLLDKYGHDVARRVCSAIAIVLMLTIVPPLVILVWVYNCTLDLLVNVGYGWVRNFMEHVTGVTRGSIDDIGEDHGA